MLAVRLPEDVEERLDCLARNAGRARSLDVREALAEILSDREDFHLAEKRMESYSTAKAIPRDDLLREYGADC